MRFSESNYSAPGQMDFMPRQKNRRLGGMIFTFVAALLIISVTLFSSGGRSIAVVSALLAIAALGFYVVYRKQQNLDLVMTTEFQNMLFAQAAALGSSFLILVRNDGSIVYANDGLRTIFSKFNYANAMALEGLFAEGGVSTTDRSRIMGALAGGSTDRLVFPIRSSDGTSKDYVLSVEPLARPAGFAAIRGREFMETRTGTQMLPDALRAAAPEKIDHLLRTSVVAQYITDPFGRIEYANPALEKLLGYDTGEFMLSTTSIQKLFAELNGSPVPDDYTLADYHGGALLRTKAGNLVQVTIAQSILRDGNGKTVAATGAILTQPSSY